MNTRVIAGVLVAIGIALQLQQYLANVSLSLDEAFLALNLLNRTLFELFKPLSFNQGAPPVFLALQKAAVILLGKNEYAIRFVPLIAACISVLLFPRLAARVLDDRGIAPLFALLLFVFSDPLIAYSSLDKQYSTDVAVIVIGYLLVLRVTSPSARPLSVAALVAYTVIAPWFSFPSFFLVIAIAITLGARALTHRHWSAAMPGFLVAGTSAITLGAVYFVSIRKLGHLQASLGKANAFLGAGENNSVGSLAGTLRYVAGINHLTLSGYDVGRPLAAAAGLLCLLGSISLLRRRTETAFLLLLPIALVAAASALGQYPLLGRTLLFLLPSIVLLMAEGLRAPIHSTHRRFSAFATILAVGIAICVTVAPLKHIDSVRTKEQMKPILAYLAQHQRKTDTLYVYYPSQYGLAYYLRCSCGPAVALTAYNAHLWPVQVALGGRAQYARALKSDSPRLILQRFINRDPQSYVSSLSMLRHRRRVWVLFSDIPRSSRQELLSELDKMGRRKVTFRGGSDDSSAVVHLYDFGSPPS